MQEKMYEKRSRPLLWLTIGIVILLLFVAANLTIRLNFILGDELVISLKPEQSSLSLHYGEKKPVEFNFSVENPSYCTAVCAYSFEDKSQGKVVEGGNISLSAGEQVMRNYTLEISRVGRGQDVYRFDVSCHNVRGFFCLTGEKASYRSSLVVVNYDLSAEEKVQKEVSRILLQGALSQLADMDITLKNQSERIVGFGNKVKIDDLQEEKASLDQEFSMMAIWSEGLRQLWNEESYAKLQGNLNESRFQELESLKENINRLQRSISDRVAAHNAAADEIRYLAYAANHAGDAHALALKEGDVVLLRDIESFVNGTRESAASFGRLGFDNYSSLSKTMSEIQGLNERIENQSKSLRVREQVKVNYLLGKSGDYACLLQKNGSACAINETIKRIYGSYKAEKARRWNESAFLSDACHSLEEMERGFGQIKNESLRKIAEERWNVGKNESFNESAGNLSTHIHSEMQKGYNDSLKNYQDEEFRSIMDPLLANGYPEVVVWENETLLRAFLLLAINLDNQSQYYLNSTCPLISQLVPGISVENITAAGDALLSAVNSSIDLTLSDNPPLCCIFGSCKPCCTESSCKSVEETFPVIFLHGHAFSKASTPAFSLDAFNLIQYGLEDEGYLSAGVINPLTASEGVARGEWGLSGKPVTVRASYYQDLFKEENQYVIVPTKSENIDTYALRLRDIITGVKERTGKDKVNIIAHSMGGLVARRYIQIFGDEDMDKLIMIATPNKGITSKSSEYCPLFGEQKECIDMQQGSLFLNKLNDPSKQPKKVRLYTIAGIGCGMGKDDGDGLIIAKSAHLPDAQQFNISGTCGGLFGSTLHSDLLNIQKYPETMEVIREILRG